MQPKVLLQDVNFDFEKGDDVSYNPHIAYTLPSQNGAASGKNNAFLLKSDDIQLSEDDMATLKELQSKEQVTKSVNNKRRNLQDALMMRFPKEDDDEYHYGIYVEDFDMTHVYFEKKYKTYMLGYATLMNDMVKLSDDEPTEVVRQDKYVPLGDMGQEEMNDMFMRFMPEMMKQMMPDMSDELMKQLTPDMTEPMIKQMTPEMMAMVMPMFMRFMMMNPMMDEMVKTNDAEGVQKMVKSFLANPEANSEVNTDGGDQPSGITKGETQVDNKEFNLEDILKSAEFQDVIKAQVEAQTADLKAQVNASEEVAKAAQSELAAKKEAEIVKAQSDLTAVVKSWGVEDSIQESVVKGIFANEHSEALIKAFDALAQEVVEVKKSFGETTHGQDVNHVEDESIVKQKNLVDEIIKRNNNK